MPRELTEWQKHLKKCSAEYHKAQPKWSDWLKKCKENYKKTKPFDANKKEMRKYFKRKAEERKVKKKKQREEDAIAYIMEAKKKPFKPLPIESKAYVVKDVRNTKNEDLGSFPEW